MRKLHSVLFIGPQHFPSFVQNDYDWLKEKYQVKVIKYPLQTRPFQLLNHPLKRLIDHISMIRVLPVTDLVFVWFANAYALFAIVVCKILGKKSTIVAGGIDAAYVPRIRYGLSNFFWGRIVARYCFGNADLVLSVSKYNKEEVCRIARPRHIEVVYNGVDIDFYSPANAKRAEILTVAGLNPISYWQKGFETLKKVARLLPNQKFTVVTNMNFDYAQKEAKSFPANVVFKGPLTKEELLFEYRRSKVYFQPSEHESFGVALAEAMACNCIPVATAKSALPEIVAEDGLCSNDPNELAQMITTVLHGKVSYNPRLRVMKKHEKLHEKLRSRAT